MPKAPTMPPPRRTGDRDRLREQRDSQHHHHRAPAFIACLRRQQASIPSRSSRPAQRRHASNTIHAPAGDSVQSRVKQNQAQPGPARRLRRNFQHLGADTPGESGFRTSWLAPANTPPSLLSSGTVGAFPVGPQPARLPARPQTPSHLGAEVPKTEHTTRTLFNPKPTPIAAVSPRTIASSRCGTFSQAELT